MNKFIVAGIVAFVVLIMVLSHKSSNKLDHNFELKIDRDFIEEKKPPQEKTETVQERLLKLHNIQRELKGRPKLVLNQKLNDYADNWAKNMAKKDSLYHSSVRNLLGDFSIVGENIAWNQQTPEEVTKAWMNSTGHRENILSRNFNQVGFAVHENGTGPYWCANFGN